MTGIRTHIYIGNLEILRTPRVWLKFERHKPLSQACITIPNARGDVGIALDDPVEIHLGYRDKEPAVWRGKVAHISAVNKDQIDVGAVGLELPLAKTRITETYENEPPEAIIKNVIKQAGLAAGQIYSTGVVIPRFVASNIPVWQVVRQAEHTCQQAFGMDMSGWGLWMDSGGLVNWGNFDESAEIPVIATGDKLIRHLPADDSFALNTVETFLLPGFRASQKLHLKDTKRGIDAEFRALVVEHRVTPRSIRTHIQYGEEYARS